MKKKNKTLLITSLVILTTAIGGVATAVATDGFTQFGNKERPLVVDNSRIAVTMHGTQDSKWTYCYVYMDHPKLEDSYIPESWPGIMPKDKVNKDGYDYISYLGDDTYTIEFTNLLPLEYEDYSKFVEDGGTINVVLSYASEDNSGYIQSKDILLDESGNHYFSMPTENYGDVAHNVQKFEKYEFVEIEKEEEEEKEDSTSCTSTSTSSSTETTSNNITSSDTTE